MDNFYITGPVKLSGEIQASSSKNSTLPLMASTLLCNKPITFKNLPNLRDIKTTLKLLNELGTKTSEIIENSVTLESKGELKLEAPYELVKKMRASILVLGPLLSRFGKAKVSLPGGCAIGSRPIDIHLLGFEKMGAKITLESGYVLAEAKELIGAHIVLPFPSVGATENLITAAVFAKGKTIIENAAREPEIVDLCNFLKKAFTSLKIEGAGTAKIEITGIEKQDNQEISYTPIPDRIESITYIIAALLTKSDIKIQNSHVDHFKAVMGILRQMGAVFEINDNSTLVLGSKSKLKGANLETSPFPGFPTDAQAQIMTLMTQAEGVSVITENIFENRFMHVPELVRMGANIKIKGKSAIITGGTKLSAAPVMCTDLRASAALVLAALIAEGESKVQRVYHIDRGYDGIDKKLSSIGAKIKRVNEPME